jgi:hypothetical protein
MAAQPRTLTEALRILPAAGLSRLLRERDDLADPPPRDLTELASRATTTPSVTRALGRLDAWRATVAEGLAALPDPAPVETLAALLDQPMPVVASAVDDLRALALVWGAADQLHLVRPAREAFQPFPGGLAPPSPRPLAEAQIDAALEHCGPAARKVLDRLLWSPTGKVRNADRTVTAGGSSPVDALLAAELLRPLDADTVILPAGGGLAARGGPATSRAGRHDAAAADRTDPQRLSGRPGGRRRRLRLLDDLELLVESLDSTVVRPLRTGGLATRDVTALARRLDTDAAHTTFVLECAYAARLVALGPAGLAPTTAYDTWLAEPAPHRWRSVVEAWRTAPRFFLRSAAVGAHALGPEAEVPRPPTCAARC